jgi:hypothetical protein
VPQVTKTDRKVYVHCVNPRCAGIRQEEVDGFAEETAFMFTDNGGDIPGVERSTVRAKVADDEDAICPFCEGPRDVSLTPRPQYQRLSGHDPMGLLDVAAFDANRPVLEHKPNAEVDELKQQLAELRAMVEKGKAA